MRVKDASVHRAERTVLEWALHVGAGDGDPALALWLERPT